MENGMGCYTNKRKGFPSCLMKKWHKRCYKFAFGWNLEQRNSLAKTILIFLR